MTAMAKAGVNIRSLRDAS